VGAEGGGRLILPVCLAIAIALHAGLLPVMAGVFRSMGTSVTRGIEVVWSPGTDEAVEGGTLPLELMVRGGDPLPAGLEVQVRWSRTKASETNVVAVTQWVAPRPSDAEARVTFWDWSLPRGLAGPGWLLARARLPGGGWTAPAARPLWIASEAPPAVGVAHVDAPDAVAAGGVLSVGFTLTNSGAGWARGGVTDRVELRPVDAGAASPWTVAAFDRRAPLGPGASAAFSPPKVRLPADVVPGRYEVVVTPGDAAHDANGSRAWPIEVRPATHPDLAVADLDAPLTVTAGRPFPLRFAVENRSPAATGPGLWGDRVVLSADDVLDPGDVVLKSEPRVKGLAGFDAYASPEHAVTLDPADATSPVMYLIVSVDDAGDLDEGAFEGNNVRARPVTVVHPQDADAEVPEIELGREDAPAQRITVAWISHDDFEDLQARRSVTHQPAVQARVEPAPDAPLRSDASPDVAGPERWGAVDTAAAPARPASLRAADDPAARSGPFGGPSGGGTAAAGVSADPAPEPAAQPTPPAPPTPSAPPAVAATTPQPTPEPRPSRTPRSDREADPTAPVAVSVVRPGTVRVGPGLEVLTVRPRFSATARVMSVPRNPEVVLTFDADGTVRVAELRTSTGFDNIDGPLLSSLYAWTATGPRLAAGPEVRVAITILFREPAETPAEPDSASGAGGD